MIFGDCKMIPLYLFIRFSIAFIELRVILESQTSVTISFHLQVSLSYHASAPRDLRTRSSKSGTRFHSFSLLNRSLGGAFYIPTVPNPRSRLRLFCRTPQKWCSRYLSAEPLPCWRFVYFAFCPNSLPANHPSRKSVCIS